MKPTRSAKRTVATRRSSWRLTIACPQAGQNRAPSGASEPQEGQVMPGIVRPVGRHRNGPRRAACHVAGTRYSGPGSGPRAGTVDACPSLRDRRVALLVGGQAVNAIGSWCALVALWGYASFRFDAGPSAIAVLGLAWALPALVLGPVAGVPVDRLGPKRVLVVADGAAGVVALCFLLAGSFPALVVLAAIDGVTKAFSEPAFRGARAAHRRRPASRGRQRAARDGQPVRDRGRTAPRRRSPSAPSASRPPSWSTR